MTTEIHTTMPCYEVAQHATDGEYIRLRATTPDHGFSHITIATKDPTIKGKFAPGKSYQFHITEVPPP